MPSFGRSAVLLLSLAGPAAARRIVAQDASLSSVGPAAARRTEAQEVSLELAGHGENGTVGGDLVNIDAYLQQSHIKSKVAEHGVRCCCDGYGSTVGHNVHKFFHQSTTRTRRCGLWTHTSKCGSLKKPKWAVMALSSAQTAEQACQVDKKDIPAIYKYLGSPEGTYKYYCPGGASSSLPGKPTMANAALGDSVWVKCEEPGWESHMRVRCIEAGGYEPQPECTKAQSFCQNTALDLPGKPQFMAAAVDDPMEIIFCSEEGYEMTEGAAATCGKDGQPVPSVDQPFCKKAHDYCSFFGTGAEGGLDLSPKHAELGQKAKVICNAAGFEPSVEEVTCNALQEFEPEPGCQKI